MSQNARKLLETANETVTAQIAATLPAGEDVLILDEVTASVDVETEHQIQAALSHLVEGRTTFAIARSALHPAQRRPAGGLERGQDRRGRPAQLMAR